LATKHDLKEIELEIDNKLSRLESEMKSEFKIIKWILALIVGVTVLPILKEIFS